jgi:hypothetical protein
MTDWEGLDKSVLRFIYEDKNGSLIQACDGPSMPQRLDMDTRTVREVVARLRTQLLVEARAGGIGLTVAGLDYCEETFGPLPGRRENRERLLLATYRQAEGQTTGRADALAAAQELGIANDEVMDAVKYWIEKDYWISKGSGGALQLTLPGVQFVERFLLPKEPV